MRSTPCVLVGQVTLVLGACGHREGDAPPSSPSGDSNADAPNGSLRSGKTDPATALGFGGRHVSADARVMAEDLLEGAGIGIDVTSSGKFAHLIWARPVDEDRARAILLANDATRTGVRAPKAK